MSKNTLFAGAAAVVLSFTAAMAVAADSIDAYQGDAANGEAVFKKCKVCHAVEPGGKKVGPSLYEVVGRTPGTLEGYKYSAGMIEFGANGAVWDEATIFRYLAAPKEVVPKTKMIFQGLENPQDRADVIAYLKTLTGAGAQ